MVGWGRETVEVEQRDGGGGTNGVGAGRRDGEGGAEGWWGGAVFVGLTRWFSGDILKQTPPSPQNLFLILLRAVLLVVLGGGGPV